MLRIKDYIVVAPDWSLLSFVFLKVPFCDSFCVSSADCVHLDLIITFFCFIFLLMAQPH